MARRRLFYVPGLISLIGIPILALLFKPPVLPHQTCLSMFLPSDRMPSKHYFKLSKYSIYQEIKKKHLVAVSLNDDNIHQNKFLLEAKRNFITRELERLAFTGDTSTVLSIELGNQSTFGDFAWLLNEARIYQFKRYALADDHFFFLTTPYRFIGKPVPAVKVMDL